MKVRYVGPNAHDDRTVVDADTGVEYDVAAGEAVDVPDRLAVGLLRQGLPIDAFHVVDGELVDNPLFWDSEDGTVLHDRADYTPVWALADDFDPSGSVEHVLAEVGDDPNLARAALDLELARPAGARKTLVSRLEALIQPDPDEVHDGGDQ